MNEKQKALIIEEATNLKKFAKASELAKLSFAALDPDNAQKCIYGQMTGSCKSERADKLIQECTAAYYPNTALAAGSALPCSFPVSKSRYFTKTLKIIIRFSPIENGLFHMTDNQKKNLIAFLKDETQALEL